MRLDELSLPPDRAAAEVVLVGAGYSVLGSGYSGDVYGQEGKNSVLKLFSASDISYILYIELVKSHPNNPHFPCVKGRMLKVTPDYNAVRLERLTPYTGSDSLIMDIKCYIHDCQRSQSHHRKNQVLAMPSLQKSCELIAGITHRGSYLNLDIKSANIMMRGSTLVFTDPVL